MTLNAILTLIAIVTGPIFAVLLTWWLDRKYRATDRRLGIFRDLMQTRGLRLYPQHVAALNIIELEFYNNSEIRTAFKNYIDHLGQPTPEKESDQGLFNESRLELLMDLLSEIGNEVGYKFDKMELVRRSYVPVGWHNDHYLQQKNAKLLNSILSGERPIPITNFLAPFPYPEPSKINEEGK
jgi:hypothetical protein